MMARRGRWHRGAVQYASGLRFHGGSFLVRLTFGLAITLGCLIDGQVF